MSQLAVKKQITQSDLTNIIVNASFMWERLNTEKFVVGVNQVDEQEINHRLEHWCHVVAKGDWATFEKRLNWESLDINTVRSRLGTVELIGEQPLPEWAKTLQEIIQTTTNFTVETESFLPTNPDEPIPFEDIFLPMIKVARQQLLTRLGCLQLAEDKFPLSILSKTAYSSLEYSLLQRLVDICSKTLNFEFSLVSPFSHTASEQKTEKVYSKVHYTWFVHQMLQDGLLKFFQKYSVLGKLVAKTLNFWVEFTLEFLQHLAEDRAEIQVNFSQNIDQVEQPYKLGKVTEIQTSLSDPHNQGKTVVLLTFESGLKLIYKPKNLELEIAFNQFLDWCNQHSQLLDFKVTQILNRDHYGWMEYIEYQSCTDEAAAERFYQRTGMLLCVLYVLRGTDCHFENLIASGENIVFIDMETLLQHEANLMDSSLATQELETQQLENSVLRTGFLPSLNFNINNPIGYDFSALGSINPQHTPQKIVPHWQAINTDNMQLGYKYVKSSIQKNVPRLSDHILLPHDYQVQIRTGFEQMYRFLMTNRDALMSPDNPLAVMRDQQVRFVFRPTRVYALIMKKALAPDYLKHGVDYSIELDHLSRAFLVAQEKPNALPILNAELQAMEQLDIPVFKASTASEHLNLQTHQSIPFYFKQPSYQDVFKQLQALNEIDLGQQLKIIQDSLSVTELSVQRNGFIQNFATICRKAWRWMTSKQVL